MKIRKPALTDRVIRGLIACTSEVSSSRMDAYSAREQKEIDDADQWVRRVREWKAQKKERKS